MRKFAAALAAGTMIFGMAALSAYPALSAGVAMDENGDGVVNAFDLVAARQKGLPAEKLSALSGFLLGQGGGYENHEPEIKVDIDESCILEPKGTVHTGDGTYYDGGYVGGCAMLDPVPSDRLVVAMNIFDYNDAQLAGAYLEVTGELGTINMLVTDLLPEGKKGDLDLNEDAFPLIAPKIKGRVPVSWKIVPLDTAADAPVCYKWKEGTSQYWAAVQVRNHRYPITRLEYLNSKGEFEELPRRYYNYFESDKLGTGPFTFRITDIYGQMIIDENIPLSFDDSEIIPGHVQFPE